MQGGCPVTVCHKASCTFLWCIWFWSYGGRMLAGKCWPRLTGEFFVLWDVYVHLDVPMLCCFHLVFLWHRSSHLNLLAWSFVIIQAPACHQLNMKNSNCMPKSNSLVKWFVLDVLWDRDYQRFAWVCWGFGVFACVAFEGWERLRYHPY